MIASTFQSVTAADRTILPYLHPREIDNVLDAIDSGELRAVVDEQGAIIALAQSDVADTIAAQDGTDEVIQDVRHALDEATRELNSLREIVREVMVEKHPPDHDYRIENAADDVQSAIAQASDSLAGMS